MPTPTAAAPVRAPLQQRSRRTFERILDATERLLDERPFEELGVREVVESARASVGSFYARFADKHALLDALYARYDAGLDARIAAWRASRPAPSSDLEGACRWVAEYLVESFAARRHLLRALALHVRQRPEVADVAVGERRARQHAFLHAALLCERDRIADAEPERAVRSAVFLAASACRERVLFRETPHARQDPMSDAGLVVELARLMLGYLQCPTLGPTP